jgi:RNA polymerase sigma factor for flagellar operon FliA
MMVAKPDDTTPEAEGPVPEEDSEDVLSPEQERAAFDQRQARRLWRRFKEQGDQSARDQLIVTYAPLVKYVAGRMSSALPSHVEESDLMSYGLIGLINAVERFDPGRAVKFETYAVARIKGSIIDELRSLDWVPRSSASPSSSSTGSRGRRPRTSWPRL